VRERIAANSYKPFTDPSVDKRVLRRQKFEGVKDKSEILLDVYIHFR
jgi:hypothetical protein